MSFFKTPPWDHQLTAFERCKDLKDFALFFEMGTGKTKTVIDIVRYKYVTHNKLLPTLILSPLITLENWKREFLIHSSIDESRIMVLAGTKHKRLKKLEQLRENTIVIVNYEALLTKEIYAILLMWSPSVIIFDESHKCKTHNSQRTKLAFRLSQKAFYHFILTGTPILNTPMDIYAQYLLLDCGATFGTSFFKFRNAYFYDVNAGMPKDRHFPKWVAKPKISEVFNDLIYKKAMRVHKSECLDLPPLVKMVRHVTMSPKQNRVYREMEKHMVSVVGENKEAVVADLAITKMLRMMQIGAGFYVTDDQKTHMFEKNPRLDILAELLEELTPDHKVIVWSVFKATYIMIAEVCKKLKIDYVEVHGGIKDVQKFANVDRFNDNKKCRVLIGHPASGGIGINLVAASYSIFYSRGFSLEQDLQAEARNHRGGSEVHEKITRIDLVAPGTIDEKVQEALANKMDISAKILDFVEDEYG